MKIAISSYDAGRLAAARRAGESRSNIWAAIRAQFGIPNDVKLAMDASRNLYRRGTDPREYLIAGPDGKYSHCRADGEVRPGVQSVVESDTSRFVVADMRPNGTPQWAALQANEVIEVLRDHADFDHVAEAALPAGFPTDVGHDGIVIDARERVVYFRVD